jgi:hypothetical protein
MQAFLNTVFMLRVSILAALDRLAIGKALTDLAAAMFRPVVQLARRMLRAAPVLKRCEWLLEIDAFTRRRPFVPVLSMLYVVWRGAHTTLYGHIGTDSIVYPFLAAISGYNPFLGCVCGALFGVADLCQKLVVSDISGGPRPWVSLDYWGAMVGFGVGYSSLMMMGLLPGALLRAFRRAVRSILKSLLPGSPAADGSKPSNTLVYFLGELAAGAIAACLCSYSILRYVAPVTNRASFYWRPHPETACYGLEIDVLSRLRPAAAGGGLIASLIAAIQSRRAVIFSDAAIAPEIFAECVRSMGGDVHPKRPLEGQVSEGARRVWLFLQKREFTELSPLLEEAVRLKLGTQPRTNIVLEINRQPGSEQLAVRIANAFAGKVPVVVHNLRAPAGVYSIADLRDMQARGSDLF